MSTNIKPPMTTLHLTARPPFNFLSVVNSHGWVQLAQFRFDESSQTLFYTDRLSSGRILDYRLMGLPEGVKVQTGSLNQTEEKQVREKISWILGLYQDFSS